MEHVEEPSADNHGDGARASPKPISRREMLRGAAAVPTILTLTSGSALAASSNLIGTIQTQPADTVLCLDKTTTQGPLSTNPNVYDLGAPPYGEVQRIPVTDHQYRLKPPTGSPIAKTPKDVCLGGGTNIQYKNTTITTWTNVPHPKPQGVMLSNSAMASFGARIVMSDITL